ncbi:NPCBM/NEW2 domain protein [Caulifigura coniformis]|uniref:NPCBM/NEW2 domain protein n=1 Tax=Caulifigura coniformis TaxID=2527983 RepID=A0A517SL46_9PLAN|nr:NPCBM/NEW2 domain-containing protein [Caulifigura coniformis]QDT56836.1 NPCBM/NEW2 domain protein [Caulifigura coniformis]
MIGRSSREIARWGRAMVVAAACVSAAQWGRAQDEPTAMEVETVVGETLNKAGLDSIVAGEFNFADGSSLPVDDVHAVRFRPASVATPKDQGAVAIHLAGGGRLPARSVLLVDDACDVTLLNGEQTSLKLDDVSALQWTDSDDTVWKNAVAKPPAEYDLVVLKAMPQSTSIRAFIESIGVESVAFEWDRETRTVARTQLVGVVFARPEALERPPLSVVTRGGAVIPVREAQKKDGAASFQCTLPSGSIIEIPQSEIVSLAVRSSRIRYLSEMTPESVAQRPIVSLPREWKADRNVRGEPLRAGTVEYEKGIGVQSGTSLTYELDGPAEQFAATLSLDPPRNVTADCEFVVLADGQELVRRSLKSGDAPESLRIPLKGAKRLEIRVDYGSNLDFGDHANWCDAHLVMAPTAGFQ